MTDKTRSESAKKVQFT